MNLGADVVELHFPIQGNRLPADHAYFLYSALSRLKPELHESTGFAIHTVRGTLDGRGSICLGDSAKLKIRLLSNDIVHLYSLAGKRLSIGDCTILLGAPTISTLNPSGRLWSRIVLIKTAHTEPGIAESFVESAKKQLADLKIEGNLYLEPSQGDSFKDAFARRVVRIKGATLAGFGVYVDGLSDADSMHLQARGLGGRRKMGCGIFVPIAAKN